ncbi:alkaline phosphatase family protein [Pseudomonas sp. PA-1-2A]|uniref:alkaline phosphatase D family protein n=2 Tax=Pseudomonas TaxID=286 RepID=UPI001CA68132|nr:MULTISPECIES: alkaline phosphatase D family protein [Pseudomonas]MBY8952139.1 alkaline phosphatase family protein [Pseudomonas carnis]MCF5693695.1 alkaline phosphatase family protein [Pseudomonas sp. PA-1-8C]MCF5788787.1 alkaline phosphatase family protein [Pseudomonas sp. PA-1-6G]MCF5793918.1 alkaline phosphatase family protein [Pseudomonas sp. PA-1-6B]MCF5797802.1 alkaline phosphatase family protein [Pseudomonas sp. PA-1-5A]
MPELQSLPPVLAGPLLRRLEPKRVVLWLVASRELKLVMRLQHAQGSTLDIHLHAHCQIVPVGRHSFIHLIDVLLTDALPLDVNIHYDLFIDGCGIAQWAPHLLYAGATLPDFVVHGRIHQLVHGSCRKPHHRADDGLLCIDRLLAQAPTVAQRPALLMMSGDQVYADDVAGPMLRAIHELIARLGLFDEYLEGAVVDDSAALYGHRASYYHRADLLPALDSNETLRERFFGGVKKPIFTSSTADNHLVTFAEVIAMYLLAWSPTPWTLISPQPPQLSAQEQQRYAREQIQIDQFRSGLPGVARVFAHLSTLMIFDDHDITDDWNLSAQWEETAYGHPFSKRIIGNALMAYLLCQGWGNQPEVFGELVSQTQALANQAQDNHLDATQQDELVTTLLKFQQWHYVLPTTPALVVLDTRTRRWRSEFTLKQPSGLLDWEALSELQQALLDHPSAIIVSPAPVFGVKLIETVQKVFSWCGFPLLVDAENWMAHRGAAQVILNIFRHSRTPGNYVILSGDVHYSFVYQVLIRYRNGGPNIWQITSSGIKNEFPPRLLEWFDRLNRWLYSPRSPLNWFTRRRTMQVVPYIPEHAEAGERLWNSAGIGQVFFNEEGQPQAIYQHNADGKPRTKMMAPEK